MMGSRSRGSSSNNLELDVILHLNFTPAADKVFIKTRSCRVSKKERDCRRVDLGPRVPPASIWPYLPVNFYELFASHLSLIIKSYHRTITVVPVGTRWTNTSRSFVLRSLVLKQVSKRIVSRIVCESHRSRCRTNLYRQKRSVDKCIMTASTFVHPHP